jgi:hypothetical protein
MIMMEAWKFLAGLGLFLYGKKKIQIQKQNKEHERYI